MPPSPYIAYITVDIFVRGGITFKLSDVLGEGCDGTIV